MTKVGRPKLEDQGPIVPTGIRCFHKAMTLQLVLWAIPAVSVIDRRRPGRPRGRQRESAARLLRELAGKYVWWLSPGDVAARPDLAITQTMELGDFDDQRRLEATFGRDRLADVLRGAQAGRLSARSWTYWHYRLGLARSGKVPPLPRRQLR